MQFQLCCVLKLPVKENWMCNVLLYLLFNCRYVWLWNMLKGDLSTMVSDLKYRYLFYWQQTSQVVTWKNTLSAQIDEWNLVKEIFYGKKHSSHQANDWSKTPVELTISVQLLYFPHAYEVTTCLPVWRRQSNMPLSQRQTMKYIIFIDLIS